MSGPELRLREAARAVILDPEGRVLLVRFEFQEGSLWACPGGGVEPDESHEEALRRELREEVGLDLEELGSCIWTRTHIIPFTGGRWDGQVERFYLVETEPFEPAGRLSPDELAREYVTAIRWWTPEELATSGERYAPRRLRELVAALRDHGPPAAPLDAGV